MWTIIVIASCIPVGSASGNHEHSRLRRLHTRSFDRAEVRSNLSYRREPSSDRHLQVTEGWEPIRIHVHDEQLKQQVPGAEDFRYLSEDLLKAAVRWLSLILRVRPVSGNLRFEKHCSLVWGDDSCAQVDTHYQKCGDATIPAEHFVDKTVCPGRLSSCQVSSGGAGLEHADLALYVTALDTGSCQSGGTVAYASICHQDGMDRPVAGNFNFCKNKVLSNRDNWHSSVAMAVHEIMHTLAFSSSLFPFFRYDDGTPRTQRDKNGMPPLSGGNAVIYQPSANTVIHTTLAGRGKHYITLPRVVEAARLYYKCSTLDRVALEDDGGEGSAFSHWDDRIMHTEIMTSHVSFYPRVSNMTLSLFEDTGWYKPDYAYAGSFHFGEGQGCDFIQGKCVTNGVTQFPAEFCTDTDVGWCGQPSALTSCTSGYMGKAICSSCKHTSPLPPAYRYFNDPTIGGRSSSSAYCPTWEPYTIGNGQFSFCNEESASAAETYGESFGMASRCVMSTIVSDAYSLVRPAATCREVSCLAGGLRIRVGSDWLECQASEEGTRKEVDDGRFHGDLICPPWKEICGPRGNLGPSKYTKPCMFPGVLRSNRCICAPGSINEDCSVQDISENRQRYPFGVRYLQDELTLTAGVPLAKSAGVFTWPLRPRALSGPSRLSYSVMPPLPDGLSIASEDGTLSGTPLIAMVKSPYTIRVTGGYGASTLTLFITVLCAPENPSCSQVAPTISPIEADERDNHGTIENKTDERHEEGSSVDGNFLRLVLRNVNFRSIQMAPGLGTFSYDFEAAVSRGVAADVRVIYVFSFQTEHSVVEFRAANANGNMSLLQLANHLAGELDRDDSLLRRSDFAVSYFGDVELYIVDPAPTRIWPKLQPSNSDSLILGIGDWQPWLAYVAWISFTASSVAVSCTANSRRDVNIQSKLALFFPQLEASLISIAVLQILFLLFDKLSKSARRNWDLGRLFYLSYGGGKSIFLCASSLLFFCSVCSTWLGKSRDRQQEKRRWLRAAIALNLPAQIILVILTAWKVWPLLWLAGSRWVDLLEDWHKWVLCAGGALFVASIVCACVGSCEDDQQRFRAHVEGRQDVPNPSCWTVLADVAALAEFGTVVAVVLSHYWPELEASWDKSFNPENISLGVWFSLILSVFFVMLACRVIHRHFMKRSCARTTEPQVQPQMRLRQGVLRPVLAQPSPPSQPIPAVVGVSVPAWPAQVSEAKMNQAMNDMLNMDFSHDVSRRALEQCNWDVHLALDKINEIQSSSKQEKASFLQ